MEKLRLKDLPVGKSRMMQELFANRRITGGGVHVFKPGECAHPEPHRHDTDEVFIVLQGSGIMPVDGRVYPMETGDVIVIQSGEDHHTTSSETDPMVVAWYLTEPAERATTMGI